MVDSDVDLGDSAAAVHPAGPAVPGPEPVSEGPGLSWVIGAALIPLFIALIGYGAYERPMTVNGPTGTLPTIAANSMSSPLSLSLSLVSINRSGDTVTLIGDFPDEVAKAALMNALQGMLAPGLTVINQIHIDPLVHTLDFANAEPVFAAGALIPDFSFKVERDTVTLAGNASPEQREAVERAVAATWPDVIVANDIVARTQVTAGAPPPPDDEPQPEAPPPPPPVPAGCDDLPAAINGLTGGPLYFGGDGVSLTPETSQSLVRVADRLKECGDARVTINGFTDNTGGEAINIPLSDQRAEAVAEFLIANGVARDRVTSKGMGSADPIADNGTPDGRAANRRAEIVVG
ncbi:OmpA family protein [Mycobacterium sp.]|uniref:channel-forming protein ArfA/OmpATb n=1 Tax=Mycobacterium sp. TaxID=1785 RepID=UPI003A8A215F